MAIITIKHGGTYSGTYSGEGTISYYYTTLRNIFSFSLFVSGITQLQTFLSRILITISGSAICEPIKNMLSTIIAKEKSNTWKIFSVKNSLSNIRFNLNVVGVIKSIKNMISTTTFDINYTQTLPVIRNAQSAIDIFLFGDGDLTVATYRLISEFLTDTIDDLSANTLEEMMYTSA